MVHEVSALIFLGLISAAILFLGARKGYFKIAPNTWTVQINIFHVLGAFAIYFFITFVSMHFALRFFKPTSHNHLSYLSWFNFSVSAASFCVLALYWALLPKRGNIARRDGELKQIKKDALAAIITWGLSFPLVLFLTHALEYLIYHLFGVSQVPDQVAVQFVKSTFSHPLYFILALSTIVLFAPFIEELLFRGFLQSYIRKHLGRREAIVVASVCFALFHFSFSQGLGNLAIIPALFVLSLFLGVLYEKQGSILAPMMLHAIFNAINVVNLFYFGE